ncbi:MAG: radical SAM protein [Eubacteriaceae bacterium]|nr:radical SAM protein [Eubacteriaceae bacterium]
MRKGNYGKITALALDPIEKKPLKMFYPGSMILSVGSYGCNLRCPWCQNYNISVADGRNIPCIEMTPKQLAEKAAEHKDSIGLAYTYNEPLVGWDFVRDTGRLIHEKNLKNVLVTNGCFGNVIIDEILPYMDAMNIDLKGYREEIYKDIGGDLETVKHFIERSSEKCHVEVTSLIVPGVNDSIEDMDREARWIAGVDENIPLHVSRFFPAYHMIDVPPTDRELILQMAETAGKYLNSVFTGNM